MLDNHVADVGHFTRRQRGQHAFRQIRGRTRINDFEKSFSGCFVAGNRGDQFPRRVDAFLRGHFVVFHVGQECGGNLRQCMFKLLASPGGGQRHQRRPLRDAQARGEPGQVLFKSVVEHGPGLGNPALGEAAHDRLGDAYFRIRQFCHHLPDRIDRSAVRIMLGDNGRHVESGASAFF